VVPSTVPGNPTLMLRVLVGVFSFQRLSVVVVVVDRPFDIDDDPKKDMVLHCVSSNRIEPDQLRFLGLVGEMYCFVFSLVLILTTSWCQSCSHRRVGLELFVLEHDALAWFVLCQNGEEEKAYLWPVLTSTTIGRYY
jgi:hypothetical protein